MIRKTFHFTHESAKIAPYTYRSGPSGYHMEKLEIVGNFDENNTVFHLRTATTYEECVLNFYDIKFVRDEKTGQWKVNPDTISDGEGWLPCDCMGRDWQPWFSTVVEQWLEGATNQ